MDGISAEFYIKFWDLVKRMILTVYDESFSLGTLPECMKVGVITLLEKKSKDRLVLANWHPITLLNTDYKLLTKLLAERLKTVLASLVNSDQN